MTSAERPRRFRTAEEFCKWLTSHHADVSELWLALKKQGSTAELITYREAIDEALAFGWIDGVRKGIDEATFKVRFTQRKAKSYWSAVNIRRAEELRALGRMADSGLAVFEARDVAGPAKYSFEREAAELDPALLKTFREERGAWKFFEAQPPYYRRVATFWVMSAKREATRARRLGLLIEVSAKKERLAQLTGKK